MNITGWILMFIAWGGILALAIYCYAKIFSDNGNDQAEAK